MEFLGWEVGKIERVGRRKRRAGDWAWATTGGTIDWHYVSPRPEQKKYTSLRAVRAWFTENEKPWYYTPVDGVTKETIKDFKAAIDEGLVVCGHI